MSESRNADIEKLRKGEVIPAFKAKTLAKFVREYEKAGGVITNKPTAPGTVS